MQKRVTEKEGYVVDLDFDEYTKDVLLKLRKQREERRIDCEYIFCSLYDGEYKQINNSTANDWSKFAGNLIGIEILHCHDFRHSEATLLKNAGMSLEDGVHPTKFGARKMANIIVSKIKSL